MSLTGFLQEELAEFEKKEKEQVEVIGDSIEECLALASVHFGKKIHELDYTVLKRGRKRLFFSEPFHIRVSIIPEDLILEELSALDERLTGGTGKLLSKDLKDLVAPKNKDGRLSVKIYKTGVFLTVYPPLGEGTPVAMADVTKRLSFRGVAGVDPAILAKIIKDKKGEPVLISNQKPKQGNDSSCNIEIGSEQMKAFVTIFPARPGGRDLEVNDIVVSLKNMGISYGLKEADIKQALDEDKINTPFVGAEGDHPVNGNNAEIRYYVRTEKKVNFKEDQSGRVDYKDLDMIENVVVGQLLAEKIPAQKGKLGRNLFGMVLPAKDGSDVELKQGKGTILSEDKMRLTAEVNGQVLYALGKLSVETVYRINGDVGVKTGNVTFLGSIIITGNVEDNYSVKAAGNIEIYGTVQKAIIEADGDIIVRQGVTGREEARVESTGGNIVAKFIQNATVITERDIIVQEGILHSHLMAGGKVSCKGKRGQIVGGTIQAAQLIAAKIIGSQANPQTDLIVGVNPKILKQINEYEEKKNENQDKFDQLTKTMRTLRARKEADPASFSPENEAHLQKLEAGTKKLEKRIQEYDKEIQTLTAYMEEQAASGRVSVEKTIFPGVSIRIRNADFKLRHETKAKTFFEEGGQVRSTNYEDPDEDKNDWRKKRGRAKPKN
ncbi:polymerase [Leptospira kobayashii]|uniref:Polymerase n=1 Tax=Leptospira kobayashii TaxID=1917830 RepID=A0ABM7ULF3_9LEPT|nr:FapA family protein [Leptospira kobayashii]BDA79660.1 polymerase [Leptospira kobayashii]